jgi:hypothetical protein
MPGIDRPKIHKSAGENRHHQDHAEGDDNESQEDGIRARQRYFAQTTDRIV